MESHLVHRVASVTLSLVAVMVLAGCTSGEGRPSAATGPATSSCSVGGLDPATTLRAFFASVQDDQQDAARRLLQPGGEVPDEAWAALSARLDGLDLDELKFTSEQMGSAVSLRVILPDGSVLGTFQTHAQEGEPRCAAVVWGTYPEVPGADSSGAATA